MAKSAEKPSSPSSNPKQSTSSGSSSSRTSAATTTAGPPTEALMTLLSPDGYYTFLGIDKPEMQAGSSTKSTIDEDLVKKNYRKLSLKHHPDRPTGDAETFHALNRAHKVLLNQKLREQYDLLGLDLDDDVVDEEHEQEDDDDKKEKKPDGPTTAESIIAHIFSTALMSVMQLGVRTVMMGTVSVLVCRYWWTLTPALLLLGFVCFRMYTTMSTIKGSSILDLLSPCSIGLGLLLMFYGRSSSLGVSWSYMFWVGEALVMTMFTYNSFSTKTTAAVLIGIAVAALLITLWLRGMFWRYATIVGLEAFLAIVIALAFPLMEMVLEEIVKDKLRKVGEQVRAHAKRTEAYYASNR